MKNTFRILSLAVFILLSPPLFGWEAARPSTVVFLSDFGLADDSVSQCKGVMESLAPGISVVDLTHEIPPFDIRLAAFYLADSAAVWPGGTVFMAVVDPGVGTERPLLAARFGGQHFLFPDNGVISHVAATMPLEALHALRDTRYVPPAASRTFHGRDVLAPLAADILNGLQLRHLGPTPDTYKLLDLPQPQVQESRIIGTVVYIDRFGNCVSNIAQSMLQGPLAELDRLEVSCGGHAIGGLSGMYGFVEPGKELALVNSMGLLEVAVNQGSAHNLLGLNIGAEMTVRLRGST